MHRSGRTHLIQPCLAKGDFFWGGGAIKVIFPDTVLMLLLRNLNKVKAQSLQGP